MITKPEKMRQKKGFERDRTDLDSQRKEEWEKM